MGIVYGTTMGVIKGDTRGLDYSSYCALVMWQGLPWHGLHRSNRRTGVSLFGSRA